jgi:AcrR family transcriptional regulator
MARQRNLTRERVVQAALDLIDRDGIDALSMRALGRSLGVEGMALYTHVGGKSDLLDAVALKILEELDLEFDSTGPWQERIRRVTIAWAGLQERHPRSFVLVYRSGLPSGAVEQAAEEILDALRAAGFDERGAALAYQTIVVFVDGALIGRSSRTDDDLQSAWARIAATADLGRYPRYAAAAQHAARLTWDEILDSGLSALLDGLRARLLV